MQHVIDNFSPTFSSRSASLSETMILFEILAKLIIYFADSEQPVCEIILKDYINFQITN